MRKKTAPSVFCHLTLVNVEMGFTWLFLFYVHTLVDCFFVFFLVCGFVLRTLLELEMGSSFML